MVLAGLGLNPAGVLPFRNHALQTIQSFFRTKGPLPRSCFLQSSFRTKGPLPRSCFPNLWHVLLGFLCLWLHCWGFFACGCIAGVSLLVVAWCFSFFRPSERNVRQFYGGWFWQVWAWILLGFCRFGTTLYRAPFGRRGHFHGAAFQTCGMSCWGFFACGCTAGVCIVVALLGFLCLWLHHLSFSLGRQNATVSFSFPPPFRGRRHGRQPFNPGAGPWPLARALAGGLRLVTEGYSGVPPLPPTSGGSPRGHLGVTSGSPEPL